MAKPKAAAKQAPAPAPADAAGAAQSGSQDQGSADGAGEQPENEASDAPAAPPAQPPVIDEAAAVIETQVADEDDAPKLSLDDVEWPFKVRILNHSAADLSCRVSGAYLPAAGWAITHLHDEAHAAEVSKSLAQLAAENFIDPKKLVVEPA